MLLITISIVGIDYPNRDKSKSNRRFELKLCKPGDPLELVLEPGNEHDEHAIAVFRPGIQVGYLPSERAVLVGSYMRRGADVQAVFQALDEKVGWCRVSFDGQPPTLPPARAPAEEEDDSGFWPDPVYDD